MYPRAAVMPLDRHAAGARVGPYEVLRFLAEGGMGAVYEARDTRDDRRVALKVLVSAATQAVDRFEREARLTLALDHPHIVKLHAWARDGDGAYMAMELLHGRSLAARLTEGPVAPAEAVRIAAEVCDALEHAHARRVVHRDLTPANIFLTDSPGAPVKVLDFGIARVVGEAAFTRTGTFLGTLRYVAPEQVTSAATVDARADLWTLGVVLFECLTGHRAFDAEHHAAVLLKITAGEIPDAATLHPGLPRDLLDVLRATLVRDRDARIAANRRDFEARHDRARLLMAHGQWTAAMDELLEILMRDKAWSDELARKTFIAILEIIEPPKVKVADGQIPPVDPVVATYRRRLSSVVLS